MATTRVRRGKVVEIPPEWRGRTVYRQTVRKRPSKQIHKRRKALKHGHERVERASLTEDE